jgi:hypothetical protein
MSSVTRLLLQHVAEDVRRDLRPEAVGGEQDRVARLELALAPVSICGGTTPPRQLKILLRSGGARPAPA